MLHGTTIHIVATTSAARAEQARLCFDLGYHAEIYSNAEELLAHPPQRGIALVEDLPERGGVASLIAGMARRGLWLPVIATSETPEACAVVAAVRKGALDYLELPLDPARLARTLAAVEKEAAELSAAQHRAMEARMRLAQLTPREREVLELLASGASNKMIARDLEISPRTVEIHRANMMTKLDARHSADAVRLHLEASFATSGGTRLSGVGG
ncbi:response regulator transcription factor [Qipengyuania sediminis]|uniref:response regulator transcription factor n=1 Tax=Qipengyuania sediminis TaxID=1532023 RepID=UPI00105A888B|nr:LuxR C-terminal-related transcriptional regulator [Qipengyuania sediminis]